MIVTLTCNPALDKTIELDAPLAPGAVQRANGTSVQAAGKGVNVARAVAAAGAQTLALLPGDTTDPLVLSLREDHLPHRSLPIHAPLRTNIALVDRQGTTTKINEPGPVLSAAVLEQLEELILDSVEGASWLVMAGSLPPGVPADFYAKLTAALREKLGTRCPRIAVDTSGEPLRQLFAHTAAHVPDLVKPNGEELAELTGSKLTEAELEASAELTAETSAKLLERGAHAVLATLGAAGAVLTTANGSWHGTHAPITPRSTVGAGDSSLAGYLLADARGEDEPGALASAVAYGAAAASLPGSTIPAPAHLQPHAVSIAPLTGREGSKQ